MKCSRMRNRIALGASVLIAVSGSALSQESPDNQDSWVVRAGTVYTAAGEAISDGTVVVENGKIASVGTGSGSGDVLEVAAVTPGLIDLSVQVSTGDYSVEQSTEAAAAYSVIDGLDLFSYRWKRERESGVTAVLAAPIDHNVIGGAGVVIKTGGRPTLTEPDGRLVKRDACLRAAIGTQPSSGNVAPRGFPPTNFYARRPTTRMGVEWVFRKTFYDYLGAKRSGAELGPEEQAQHAVLDRVMTGELPLFVQAKATQDVRTAIFLKEEFGIPKMVLDYAIECWREPELLRRSGVGVVLPPFPKDGRIADGFANDAYFIPIGTAKELADLGVPFALSAHGAGDPGQRLARQAGFAQRGGLSFEQALEAVTIQPARMVGVDDRIGSIEAGKDADLVLWSGKPFEPTAGIVGVLIDGELVLDPRPKD